MQPCAPLQTLLYKRGVYEALEYSTLVLYRNSNERSLSSSFHLQSKVSHRDYSTTLLQSHNWRSA